MFAPWRSQSSSRKHGYPITGNLFILQTKQNLFVMYLTLQTKNGLSGTDLSRSVFWNA